MTDDLFDDAAAHTLAKHQILEEYLKAWLPILARGQTNRLLYFDGFAGCGELKQGHPGSPVVAIQTAMQALPGNTQLEIRMVEKNPNKCNCLRDIIVTEKSRLGTLAGQIRIHDPICGECEQVVTELLADYAGTAKPLGPAFFFLDQYGYGSVPMELIRRILSHAKCETFAYLNWKHMHPNFSDPTKADAFTRMLGGDEWREVIPLEGQKRVEHFKAIYVRSLRERAKARHVYDFAMRGPDNQRIYWLFFCTNSLKGLEAMKKAMWTVDRTGRFEFSDRDANQGMLTRYTQEMLATYLHDALRGQELSSDDLRHHVLTKTPEFRFEEAIKILRNRECVRRERRGDKTVYVFTDAPTKTPSLFGD